MKLFLNLALLFYCHNKFIYKFRSFKQLIIDNKALDLFEFVWIYFDCSLWGKVRDQFIEQGKLFHLKRCCQQIEGVLSCCLFPDNPHLLQWIVMEIRRIAQIMNLFDFHSIFYINTDFFLNLQNQSNLLVHFF